MITPRQLIDYLNFVRDNPDEENSCAEINPSLWMVWCEIQNRPANFGAPWWTEALVTQSIDRMLDKETIHRDQQ